MQDHLDARQSKVIATVAHPGLAASNLQQTTAKNATGFLSGSLNLTMRFAQSAEDGTMPLLSCMCQPGIKPRAFFAPGKKGLLGWITNDTTVGLPKEIPLEPLCTKEESKAMLWEASEAACGPFFPV